MAEVCRHKGGHGLVMSGVSDHLLKDWTDRKLCELGIDTATDREAKEGLDCVIKHLSIRPTQKDPDRLDRRRKSTGLNMETPAIVTEPGLSPAEKQRRTSGIRGELSTIKSIHKEYHVKQTELFGLLGLYLDESPSGCLRHRDGKELNAKEFGTLIDDRTSQLKTDYYDRCNPISRDEDVLKDMDKHGKITEALATICAGRIHMQHLKPNDLSSEGGLRTWRDHSNILVSFLAFAAVSESYQHKRFGRCYLDTILV